ncbi:hypothetical protein J3R30DRAFT_3404746 [Lentinula aciculospora]|uniref:Uncharacterized protein n=1 Tax=Lentinula aciculospora TaxID=153920 RepID=A0A9W9AAB5_9AGAR|nr:hypothetical protein J3R30DRAFT_3404746 [Lentinula aciculospora]
MPYPASIPDGIDLPSSILGSSSTSPPGSPLTPLDQDFGSSAPLEVHTNLIVPPTSRLTVPNAGWNPQVLVTYRKLARDAVDIELDYKLGLGTQDINALNRARTQIENAIPEFKEHANHWGADLLLREQLKSKKDTIIIMPQSQKALPQLRLVPHKIILKSVFPWLNMGSRDGLSDSNVSMTLMWCTRGSASEFSSRDTSALAGTLRSQSMVIW